MCWWGSRAIDMAPCLAGAAALSVGFATMKNSFLRCESLRNATQDAFAAKSRRPLDICTSCEACRNLGLLVAVAEFNCSIRLPIANAFKRVNVRRICYGDSLSLRLHMFPAQKLQFENDRPTQYYGFDGSHHYRCYRERQVPSHHN